MLINVPKINKKDININGEIEKDNKGFVLSNVNNTNSIPLVVNGYYTHIATILDSYLFIIGNSIKKDYDININKLDFLSAILRFEYTSKVRPKSIKNFDLIDNIFYIMSENLQQTFNDRYLQYDLKGLNIKEIEYIINQDKIYLKAFKDPLERYIRFMSDNKNNILIKNNMLIVNTYFSDKIKVLKDSGINGYIIKYNEIE